uniref:Uncharacterized protein n=1 Tax=Arundo donax TaxID=35708 RepID=A0A0A9C8T2_ARUDO
MWALGLASSSPPCTDVHI